MRKQAEKMDLTCASHLHFIVKSKICCTFLRTITMFCQLFI